MFEVQTISHTNSYNQNEINTTISKISEGNLSVQVYTLLQNARILISHKEKQLALALLRQASNLQSHPIIFAELTQVLVSLNRWEESYMVAKQWYQRDIDFLSTYYLAQIEYQIGKDEQSLKNYFEALAFVHEPRSELFEIFKNIGNLFVRRGDFESAEEFYNKAYALKTDSDILLVNYGILEMQRGELNRARDRFRSAIQYNDRNDKAWVGLAMAHFDFGDEELGVANLKKAIDIDPQNRTALQLALQKLNPAIYGIYLIEVISQFLSFVDNDPEMSCHLIQLFVSRGQYSLASLEAQRLVLWNPDSEKYNQILFQLENQSHQSQGVKNATC
ncbi:MAG: tetratricopeptide repeat protein [Bdellovibrionales bacterium]